MRDVVIVGAGLAGSSLAHVLTGLGWDVLLIERRQLPHHKVCGEFLSPESQASLWALGLHDTVAALMPSSMEHARLVSRRGVSLRVPLPGPAWGVSRFALDHALATAAREAGAEVQQGVTVSSVTTHEQGYTVNLRSLEGTSMVQARAVVVACGRNPLPGLRPKTVTTGARPTYVGVKCHYADVTMPPQVDLFLFRGGYVGLSPIEAGRYNLCLLTTRTAFTRAGGSAGAMLDAVTRWNPALRQQLVGSQPVPGTEVSVAPVDTGVPAVPWDTVARLGDATVMIPPLCGDGMAMALRSAEICAPLIDDFLHERITLATWQEQYSAAWQQEFARPVRTGRRLQALLARAYLSDSLLALGKLLPALSRRLVQATRGQPRPLETVLPLVQRSASQNRNEMIAIPAIQEDDA